MSAILIQSRETTADHASADVTVSDGKAARPYWLFVTPKYVTVIAGKADRRTLGKTFWDVAELVAHYKRDGRAIGEVVDEMRKGLGQ